MIVGFAGYAGAGKDTAAQALIDRGWLRVAFADKLKELAVQTNPMIADSYGVPRRLENLVGYGGWERAKALPAIRELLQNLGVAARDVLGEDVWVDAALPDPDEAYHPTAIHRVHDVVVTDVRFANEASRIRRLGGKVIWVHRSGVKPLNDHASENSLGAVNCDGQINNDGSITDLHAKILAALDIDPPCHDFDAITNLPPNTFVQIDCNTCHAYLTVATDADGDAHRTEGG